MSKAFSKYWERIRCRLESGFTDLVPEFFGTDSDSPGAAVRRSLVAGKRIRGCLVCLTCEALGGSVEAATAAAVGIECVQAASLIHDDFVDGDRTRRNRPAEWTLQGSRQAVLLGDVMFATVIHQMAQRSAAEGQLLAKVIATMAKGAYQEHLDQLELAGGPHDARYDPKRYEYIIHLKTGALFGAAAQLGAIAAEAGVPTQAQASQFGVRLGEAYQIADDLVDMAAVLGKAHCRGAELAAIAPALLYFTTSKPATVLPVLRGDTQILGEWLEQEGTSIMTRMRGEISARVRAAITALGPFPASPYRDLLRDMSGQVVAAMTTTDS